MCRNIQIIVVVVLFASLCLLFKVFLVMVALWNIDAALGQLAETV
jgi:hypothetical protein